MAHDQTLVQIRERSFLEILDLALVVIRRYPTTIGLAAAAGAAPFAAFNAWLVRDQGMPAGVHLVLLAWEIPWATAPLTVVLGALMFGERLSVARTLRTIFGSFGPLVVFQVLLRGFLLTTVVLSPLVPIRMTFMNEVILLERGRWRSALGRCAALSHARGGELFGQWLAQLIFGSVFVLGFWAGSGALSRALFTSDMTWAPTWRGLMGPRLQFAVWVAIEFFATARLFNYIDQRIRLEAWEVELLLRAVGRAMEADRKW